MKYKGSFLSTRISNPLCRKEPQKKAAPRGGLTINEPLKKPKGINN